MTPRANDIQLPAFAEIPLTRGYTTIVDSADADLAEFKWWALSPHGRSTAYAKRSTYINRVKSGVFLHRIIMSRMLDRPLLKNEFVDHINGNGLDNRRCNLRLANHSENVRNTGLNKTNRSGFKGVHWDSREGKWRAQINANGAFRHIGYFDTPEEASEAYRKVASEMYGEFARFE